ncbi:related to cell division control protein/predicted DNA repair exonuclease [Rhynchosporium agropyri]|uniref:Related to cell division control protein/predicted DNA repair exonuclease n=1 Tax=Rhynchosporium agropyri TaxID=914238 RepID=A0A1E1KLF3_9HELO|nr:related to cell division control protein/predicted DNA repair exonuclease [Rhynchosporium agropyri]
MFFLSVLRYTLLAIIPPCSILTTYLYLYPVFHLCAFPSPEHNPRSEYINTLRHHAPYSSQNGSKVAPFRLLALGDPQLEGDSSIEYVDAASFPHLTKFWKDVVLRNGTKNNPLQLLRQSLHDLVDFYLDDVPKALEVWRKRLDHVGNDYYLGHIYRTMHWWTAPTHVTVLGDLVGSQWIDDDEFEARGWRYWNRVFKGGVKVSDEIASQPSEEFNNTLVLGEDAPAWKKRIINVAGNHDVGYAGDLSPERVTRFEKVFGKANYELRFQLPLESANIIVEGGITRPIPELRIVVFNDMNLDTPVGSQEMQDETYGFLNRVITTSHDVTREALFTLLLTHIPMYKEAGICVDGPFFDFFKGNFGNGVKEQNHLSMDASKGFLEGIYGKNGNPDVPGGGFGRNGVILTGHDHEGCNVYHYVNHSDPMRQWEATTWPKAIDADIVDQPGMPGLREITVQSMMGGFAGNAGLMSLWFDESIWEWQFEFTNCGLGTQHIWWLVHILDLIALGIGLVYGCIVLYQHVTRPEIHAKSGMMGNGNAKKPQERKTIQNGDAFQNKPILDTATNPGVHVTGNRSLRTELSMMSLDSGSRL